MSNIVKLADVRKQRRGEVPHHADVLSFMKRRKPKGSGIDNWAVEPSGDYSKDYETGRALGREYLAYIGRYPTNGNATLLNSIVREMAERGRVGGLEFGFLNCVNEYAMFAASTVTGVEAGS